MPELTLKLLGGFELRDGAGAEIPVRAKKLRGLIGYLALNPDRRHGREMLASLLWGDRFEAQARQSLRQALLALRKHLAEWAPDAVQADDETVSLAGARIRVDATEFERLAKTGELEAAATAYGGELLDGLGVRSEPFDTWLAEERARLHDLACDVWERLGERRLRDGEPKAAIEAGKHLVALDPLREPGHRSLMRAYAGAGRRAEALQQYRTLAETLERELGAEPDLETTRLFEAIRVGAEIATGAPTGRPPTDKPSIAVLAFENMSGDPEQEYFSDGITEDIITELSKFRMLFVVARNSTFAYKGAVVDVRQLARDLGVRYVLEGSVRKAGNRVRITAQLIDATADKHIWAKHYDQELADVFAVQDAIAQSIVTTVAPEFLSAEMLRAQRKEGRALDAWDNLMLARWHSSHFTREHNAEARRLCRKAIELDPGGAAQYAVLAVSLVIDAIYDWGPSREQSFAEARETAERAIGLDDRNALAIRSLGIVNLYSKHFDDAVHDFQRAIELDPNEAENHALLGNAVGLAGDYEAACKHVEYAFCLSPRDTFRATWYSSLGMSAAAVGRDAEAVEWAKKALQENPKFPGGHRTLAACYSHLGQLAEARAAIAKLLELVPDLTIGHLREQLPYRSRAHLERYIDGLRKAGLPE